MARNIQKRKQRNLTKQPTCSSVASCSFKRPRKKNKLKMTTTNTNMTERDVSFIFSIFWCIFLDLEEFLIYKRFSLFFIFQFYAILDKVPGWTSKHDNFMLRKFYKIASNHKDFLVGLDKISIPARKPAKPVKPWPFWSGVYEPRVGDSCFFGFIQLWTVGFGLQKSIHRYPATDRLYARNDKN